MDLHIGMLEQFSESRDGSLRPGTYSQLDQTPAGAAELQRRMKLFGDCKRTEGETSSQFYARLQHWLDRDLPQTKSPLHAPRQTGE